jgi:SNF2 family DNA or RNA helicase
MLPSYQLMKHLIKALEKYLSVAATSTIRARGKGLTSHVHPRSIEFDKGEAVFDVESSYDQEVSYEVYFQGIHTGDIASFCECPYEGSGICKHEVACIIYLIDYLTNDKNPIDTFSVRPTQAASKSPLPGFRTESLELKLPSISDDILHSLTNPWLWTERLNEHRVEIDSFGHEVAELKVRIGKENHAIRIKRQEKHSYHASCSCQQKLTNPLCKHLLAALLHLREIHGLQALELLKNWDEEKNRLLAEYGFSLEDETSDTFYFKVDDTGQLRLGLHDRSVQKIEPQSWQKAVKSLTQTLPPSPSRLEERGPERLLLYVLAPAASSNYVFSDIQLMVFSYQLSPKTRKITQIRALEGYVDLNNGFPFLSEDMGKILQLRKQLESQWIEKQLVKKYPHLQPYYINWQELDEEIKQVIRMLQGKGIDKLLPLLYDKSLFLPQYPQHPHIGAADNIRPIRLSNTFLKISLELREEGSFFVLEGKTTLEDKQLYLSQLQSRFSFWLVEQEGRLYKWATLNDASLADFLLQSSGKIKVRQTALEGFLSEFVMPLTENFELDFQIDKPVTQQPLNWKETRLYLKEEEDTLIFQPLYVYEQGENQFEFAHDGRSRKVVYQDAQLTFLERNPQTETQTFEWLSEQHPDFSLQGGEGFFYLPFEKVLKDNWFFDFNERLQEKQIPLFGFKELKKFRVNPNKATFRFQANSGTDWFDLKVEMNFGDQFVSLQDVKKALLKKQEYIQLKDGSLGLLPQEWIDRHAHLFQSGTIKGNQVRVSKFHFNLIDDLIAQTDNLALQQEIAEKKRKLLSFKEMPEVELPFNVQATLRPYQKEGFKWLCFLDEFGWGGCLADDMGLGKTLQALTFLQYQHNRFPKATSLVVLPTTLIFNWQAEAAKFCPQLRLFVHRGTTRQKSSTHFSQYHLILTTYGTLRSDIEIFSAFRFHYVILDEAQAIKNTTSQISKAVRLLKAYNRLTMTGTPVENNTFDLYSQFEFLNPGILGSEDSFDKQYAGPIDKERDENAARQLRKLLYPFLLKRTKEEVAKDLPDKTETILFCEMGKAQRKVYEAFREKYRQQIGQKMALEGKEKSAMLVLEGLLKLRQICDSPSLLSDEGEFPEESAKLEELVREIGENASDHKILIFSQFIKMLSLIRSHLEKEGIPFEYLDGTTTNRADRVQRFQTDKQCRVFLISLKAGGVGINLTEADYVYLVDPWWNPAVEQQAIDRTHRIGQTRKVFAYKMICKDSIEEKILTLQQRKKDIATDLISTENGFVKQLSQDDIIGLFS